MNALKYASQHLICLLKTPFPKKNLKKTWQNSDREMKVSGGSQIRFKSCYPTLKHIRISIIFIVQKFVTWRIIYYWLYLWKSPVFHLVISEFRKSGKFLNKWGIGNSALIRNVGNSPRSTLQLVKSIFFECMTKNCMHWWIFDYS